MLRRLSKIMALSALTAVIAMAWSSSAAQAKWLIKVGAASTESIKLTGTVNLGWLLVSGIYKIHCTGGTLATLLKLLGSGKSLSGFATATFSSCSPFDWEGNEMNCIVNSPGSPAGTIVAKGDGLAAMASSETFLSLESSEFTVLEFSPTICGAFSGTINGSASIAFDEAEKTQESHTVLVDNDRLFYGENEVFLDAENEEGTGGPVSGSIKEESGKSWAIQLVGL